MSSIYALYNKKHDKIYIGQTIDLESRLSQHRDKLFVNSYTARFDGLWDVVYKEELSDRPAALRREKQLKSYRGREFIRTRLAHPPAGGGRAPLS
jgi:putative endonuclease